MYGNKFKEATKSLMSYCKEQLGYEHDPDVHYVTDSNNANNMLGYTAHYQPDKKIVTVYISNRHPKDVLRSLSHELVHHAQNCRGDLASSQTEEGYAQKDPHMRKMEEEAYLKGNMMFRDWEDSCKGQNMILPSTIGEQKMDDRLNQLVAKKVVAKLQKEGIEIEEGPLQRMLARGRGVGAGLKARAGNFKSKLKGAVAGYKGDSDAVAATAAAQTDPAAAKAEARFKSIVTSAYKDVGIIQQDIVNNFKKMGLNRDKRGGGTIVDDKQLQDALRFLRSSQNSLAKAMGLSEDEMKKLAKFAVVKEDDDDQIEEGGCAQRQGNEDRLRRQEPDRIREEEELEEEKMPDKNKDGIPDYAQDGKGAKDLGKAKGADSDDDKEEKDDEDKKEKSDKDLSKVPPQLRKHVAKKKVNENELVDIKKKQSSINKLNETRLNNINKELMRRLLK